MLGLNKIVILVLVALIFSGVAKAAFETTLTDVQMQSILQNYFPLREYETIARVTLQLPEILLEKENKEIVLMIPVNASIIGDTTHQGHIKVLVGLSYKSSSGGLYLSNPRLSQYEMPTVDKEKSIELREFIETIVNNALPIMELYKVSERDLNHSLEKSALKHFDMEDNHVKLIFGFK